MRVDMVDKMTGHRRQSSTRVLFALMMLNICILIIYHRYDISSTVLHAAFRYHKESPSMMEKYFQPLPGTNWTILDIRRGAQSPGRKEIIGVDRHLDSEDWGDISEIVPSDTNRSSKARILIYNRVPKCASGTLIALMKSLGASNGFEVVSSQIFWRLVIANEL